MLRLWARSSIYVVGIGSVWLVLLPELLLQIDPPITEITLRTWPMLSLGGTVFGLGAVLTLWSVALLIRDGQGTPFPLDPTRRLVESGLYGFIRNPQGVALVLLTCAEALAVDLDRMWAMPLLAVGFLIGFAGPFEDWELERRFGRSYEQYRERVPKWWPITIPRRA